MLRIQLEEDRPGYAKFTATKWSGSTEVEIAVQRNQDGCYFNGNDTPWNPEPVWHKVEGLTLENDVFRLQINTAGGDVIRSELLKYDAELNSNTPFVLLQNTPEHQYVAQSGLIGKDGIVTVEAGQGLEMEQEIVEGFSYDKGYSSPFFVTDVNRQEAIFDKPLILLTDKKISSSSEILPVLEKVAQSGHKDLVIIAEEVSGEALSLLVLNKLKGVFNSLVLKAPAFGDRRKEILEDIAVLTGAIVISEDKGMKLEDAEISALGSAKKIIATKDSSTIISGAGKQSAVSDRIELIKSQANLAISDYDREQYEKRAAALSGRLAVIKVGGATETEIDEKKYRVDDAVAATKAALDEGIVTGGGVTLVNLADQLEEKDAGAKIVKNALKTPLLHILENAGLNAQALLAGYMPRYHRFRVLFAVECR